MQYIGKSLISVDWLSIYCDCGLIRDPQRGQVKKMDYGTQVYQFTEYYQRDGKDVAILTWQPRSSALVRNTGVIKILNEWLYKGELYELVTDILSDWGITALSVSRLDVCADFNKFVDYPDMQDFFQDFLTTKIWHIGKSKYKVIGKETRKLQDDSFVMQGVQSSRHCYQYLRFGGNTSDVSAYLYNKTLEFKEVKEKNYIRAMWDKNQLDNNCDVWRLEFSLKGNAIKIIDETTGEEFTNKLDIIKEPILLHRLYYTLYNSYWKFRRNDGQIRKDRMKDCTLLKLNDMPFKLAKYTLSPNTTLGDKRLISAMERVYNELRHVDEETARILNYSIGCIATYKSLDAWRLAKFGK